MILMELNQLLSLCYLPVFSYPLEDNLLTLSYFGLQVNCATPNNVQCLLLLLYPRIIPGGSWKLACDAEDQTGVIYLCMHISLFPTLFFNYSSLALPIDISSHVSFLFLIFKIYLISKIKKYNYLILLFFGV